MKKENKRWGESKSTKKNGNMNLSLRIPEQMLTLTAKLHKFNNTSEK